MKSGFTVCWLWLWFSDSDYDDDNRGQQEWQEGSVGNGAQERSLGNGKWTVLKGGQRVMSLLWLTRNSLERNWLIVKQRIQTIIICIKYQLRKDLLGKNSFCFYWKGKEILCFYLTIWRRAMIPMIGHSLPPRRLNNWLTICLCLCSVIIRCHESHVSSHFRD